MSGQTAEWGSCELQAGQWDIEGTGRATCAVADTQKKPYTFEWLFMHRNKRAQLSSGGLHLDDSDGVG